VQNWEERAVVWDRERKALERTLEKAKSQSQRGEEDPQVKYLKALHRRQQCRVEELERQVKRLEMDQTQSTETDSPGYRPHTALKEVKIVYAEGRLISEDEAELRKLQTDYVSLLKQQEDLLKDLRDTKYQLRTAVQDGKDLRTALGNKDTELKALILRYDQLANRKETVSEATLQDSLQCLEQATALQETMSSLQLKHTQTVAHLEQQLAVKREALLELAGKRATAEQETSQVRTQLRDWERRYLLQTVQLSESHTQVCTLQLELSRAQEEGSTLQSALAEAQTTIRHLAPKLTSSQEQISYLVQQNESRMAQSAVDKKAISALRSQLESSQSEFSALQRTHSELQLVLGLEQDLTLSPAELRGLAYILLSEDKSTALGLLFGREYEAVTQDYERQIGTLRQELVKEKAMHEDEVERLVQSIEESQGLMTAYEQTRGRKHTYQTFDQSDLLVRDR